MKNIPHMHENRIQYLDTIGYWPNLHENSLNDIFNSGYFDKIKEGWTSCGVKECSKQCGKFDKLGEQFENRS